MKEEGALSLFHPLVRQWFESRYPAPTDIQEQGWSAISGGSHTLMTAPTGSGKTLAAFLWSLNQLVSGEWPCGTVRVLYVSPLKALNNDVRRNLRVPLEELKRFFLERGAAFPDIRVETRSGDTSASDRRKMMRRPPEILITTPESLNILLTSGAARTILTGLSAVILDEIHAVAADKRGVHLTSAVERLTLEAGEFQRIGLSATVRPLSLVASILGGFLPRTSADQTPRPRRVSIIRSRIQKKYDIQVAFPESPEGEHSRWPGIIEEVCGRIRRNRSTLLFCNSRRQTEKVTRMINERMGETAAFAHHGSLSREIRHFVEQKLKNGELKAVVATSSLEMGIDIGEIDEVLLLSAPFSLSSAVQRIGRGGHNVGEVSRCTLFPLFGNDFLRCAAAAEAVPGGDIEELEVPVNPLDVLAQVVLSMCCTREWDIDELYLFVTSVYQWNSLPRRHFDLVLEMLNGRYSDTRIGELKPRINIDRAAHLVRARDGAQRVIYMSGGTIPDRGYYELRVSGDGARIGELDEEFVWERNHGDFFTLGTQTWRIENISDRAVEVSPADAGGAMSPFWKADPSGRAFFYSGKILRLLEAAEVSLSLPGGTGDAGLKERFTDEYRMSGEAAEGLIAYLKRQRDHTGAPLPHRRHLLVEHFNDPLNRTDCHQVILHTFWGGKLNFPFSEALAQAWENREGYPLQLFCDDDAVILDLPHRFTLDDVLNLVNGDNLERLLRQRLESTMFFGARFRHNCSRALLLPRKSFHQRTPLWLTRLRSKKLLQAVSRYEDFPILTETWRSCLYDDFDLESLRTLLDEIREGVVRISETATKTPSPFAAGLVYDHTNQRMYEDDTPLGGQSSLREELIKSIVHESGLRPMLPEALVEEFESKLQRTFPDYAPRSADDLLDWLDERVFLTPGQWEKLREAIRRDHPEEADGIFASVETRIERWRPEASREALIISKTYRRKYGDRGFSGQLETILPQWLSFYGPLPVEELLAIYPAPEAEILSFLEEQRESEAFVIDRLTLGAETDQVCTAENLEMLFRLKRRKGRSSFEPLPVKKLQLFLARRQMLTRGGTGYEELKPAFESLMAYGAPAALWETDYLPARISPYYKNWLDTLFQEHPIIWYGCGKEKIAFCFEEEQNLFIRESGSVGEAQRLLPDPRGRFGFWDVKNHSGMDSSELSKALWKHCWSGALSNDRFSALRTGILNKFSAPSVRDIEQKAGYGRWARTRPTEGHWFLTSSIPGDEDLLEQNARLREVIRQLFLRYGVLFRQLLEKETDELGWNAVFRTLRLMELSGECAAGYFFDSIPGLQFAAWDALRELSEPLDETALYWMNCTDPASLAGIKIDALKGEYPPRLPGSHLVFRGTACVLQSKRNGRELTFFTEPTDPDTLRSLGFFNTLLTRDFAPLRSIKVERVNGLPPAESPYADVLKQAGFRENLTVFVLRSAL